MPLAFSEEAQARIAALREEFPDERSALIPTLKIAEAEFGHLSDEAMACVADTLGVPVSVVAGVATFYHNFHVHPRGEHLVSVCRTLSCELGGAREVSRRLQELLGIGPGETTEDGLITFHEVECLACCGTAPGVQVDFEYFESFDPASWETVLEALRAGRTPEGGSGIPGGAPAGGAQKEGVGA